jgi:hypothetical protein
MLNTTKIKRSLSEIIKKADGLGWMIGGIDISLNDDSQRKLDVGWQAQFYGIAKVTNIGTLSKLLRDTYSPTKTVPRPIQIRSCDGSARAIPMPSRRSFTDASPIENW